MKIDAVIRQTLKSLNLYNFYRKLRGYIWKLLFIIDGFFIVSNEPNNSIALIRMDGIGDFIIWLDAAKDYRRHFPNRKIVLICNSAYADLAKKLPHWDEVWPINPIKFSKNYFYRWKLLKKISKYGFEVAVHPTYSRYILTGDSIVRATKALQRIGSSGDFNNSSLSDYLTSNKWYSKLIDGSSSQLMELLRNSEFNENLFKNTRVVNLPNLRILEGLNLEDRKKKYCIIFPGSNWSGRNWPIQKYIELTRLIILEKGMRVILCGGDNELSICANIAREFGGSNVVNRAGNTSLFDLVELINAANYIVTNETAAAHIAIALGVPSVCIAGGGHYGRFVPYPEYLNDTNQKVVYKYMSCYGCNWKCPIRRDEFTAVPCIEKITVLEVKHSIDTLIKNKLTLLNLS